MVKVGDVTFENKLGFGTNKVGGHNLFKDLRDEDGREIVRAALDAGISVIDTAFGYGLGRSEELIGEVLQDYDRSKVVLATKAAQDPARDYAFNNDPAFLTQAVEEALTRLKTDYIDIFYIHFPDESTDKRAAVAGLQTLKEAGKIRAIGLSNFSLAQVKEANADGYVDVVEEYYNLVNRSAESETWAYLRENEIAFVPYFPLASGLLTGKYTADQTFPADDWRARNRNFQGERFVAAIKGVEVLKRVGQKYDASPAQVALAWYMKNPDIAVVIPGARNAAQVVDNAKSMQVVLTDADYAEIDAAFK
jgi:aryl-alcohol dehydrogenase-like predicted oxidoreductase